MGHLRQARLEDNLPTSDAPRLKPAFKPFDEPSHHKLLVISWLGAFMRPLAGTFRRSGLEDRDEAGFDSGGVVGFEADQAVAKEVGGFR
jgi:hypothetical protein